MSSALLFLTGLFLWLCNPLVLCFLFAPTQPVCLPSKGLRMSFLWDLGILAMRRLGAPHTRRWALQEKVPAPMLNSQVNIPRGANPKHILTSVYNIEVTQAVIHYSHKGPSKLAWEWNDLV